MKNIILSFILTSLFLAPTTPAFARISNNQSSDIFYDRHWVYDRPAVASDRLRSSDMFRPIPPMWNENADLFDRAKPRVTYGREDMFTRRTLTSMPSTVLHIDYDQEPVDNL